MSRNLVASARSGLDPSADAMARVRARVALAVGSGAMVATPVKAAAVSTKIAVIGAVAIAVGIGAWVATHRTNASAEAPTISITAPAETETPIGVTYRAAARAEAAPAFVAPIAHPRAAISIPAASAEAPVVSAVPTAPASLAREVQLIDAAMASLKTDPAATLTTLTVYERETFGHGQLAEDAAALQIEAGCHVHQDVTDQRAAFRRRWPTSVQRSRITASCDEATRR